jgi:hypothetical protein
MKQVNHLLIIRDEDAKGKASYQGVLVDADDAKMIHNLFELDCKYYGSEPKRSRKMALYGLDMHGAVDQGKDAFTSSELADPEVTALSAQARLLSGRTNFTDKEKVYLNKRLVAADKSQEGWFKRTGQSKLNKAGATAFANLLLHANPVDLQDKPLRFAQVLDVA